MNDTNTQDEGNAPAAPAAPDYAAGVPTRASALDPMKGSQNTGIPTLLSTVGKEAQSEGAAEGEVKSEAAKTAPETAEGYSFEYPEGLEIDADLEAAYKEKALSLGLTNDQAGELVKTYLDQLNAAPEQVFKQQYEHLAQQVKEWDADFKASPQYKADIGHATRALARFGNDELHTIFDQTGLGSHPAMRQFAVEVGKALGEPETVGRGAPAVEEAPEKILYKPM